MPLTIEGLIAVHGTLCRRIQSEIHDRSEFENTKITAPRSQS